MYVDIDTWREGPAGSCSRWPGSVSISSVCADDTTCPLLLGPSSEGPTKRTPEKTQIEQTFDSDQDHRKADRA